MILSSLLMSFKASAAVRPTEPQEFRFKFNFKGQSYEVRQKSQSYEDAFEKAAKACFSYYKAGQKLNEEKGLDIIDICANPRS